jgi:PAS domain-containing protein
MDSMSAWFSKLSAAGELLLLIVTLLTALGFKKWGWPLITSAAKSVGRFFSGVAALSALPDYIPMIQKFNSMDETMRQVLHEVRPNGGSSLRDAVNTTRDTAKRTEVALTLFINSTRAQWDGMGMFGVFECDANGNHVYTNATYQKWTNRSDKELGGTGWINAIVFADRDMVRREWESCIEDMREFVLNYRMRDVAGHEFDVICSATPVREAHNGPVVKWVGVIRRNVVGESH